jgi:hypothetical protein
MSPANSPEISIRRANSKALQPVEKIVDARAGHSLMTKPTGSSEQPFLHPTS